MKLGLILDSRYIDKNYIEETFSKITITNCFQQCKKDKYFRLGFIYTRDSVLDISKIIRITNSFEQFIENSVYRDYVAHCDETLSLEAHEFVMFLITKEDKHFDLCKVLFSKENISDMFGCHRHLVWGNYFDKYALAKA